MTNWNGCAIMNVLTPSEYVRSNMLFSLVPLADRMVSATIPNSAGGIFVRITKGVPQHIRQRILSRDGYRCQFCGEEELRFLRVDHMIPQAHGGSDEDDNLWTLCLWCNSIKRTRVVPFQIGLRVPFCGTCGKNDHVSVEHVGSLSWQRAQRALGR